jgi:hypothetical protein
MSLFHYPHFPGFEMYHLKGSPINPDRIWASQSSGWFGQLMQRSDDGGKTWEAVGNEFPYDGVPGTHQWYDGTPHPWEFKRVWHLEPSLTDPTRGVRGRRRRRALPLERRWGIVARTLRPAPARLGAAVAARRGRHVPAHDHSGPHQPAAHVRGHLGGGRLPHRRRRRDVAAINKGLRSNYLPDEDAEVGHCVHHIAMHPSRPNTLFMQKHWDVMRSDDAGDQWHEVSGNLPTDFGFVIDVHAHEPETIYVVPIKSDSLITSAEGKLRVYRSRTGGNEWEALTKGLPQEHCYVNVLRDAMAVDTLDECGVYFGTTGGQVYVSPDGGDTGRRSCAICRPCLEARYPMLRGAIRDHTTRQRRPFIRFFACGEDLSHEPGESVLPEAVQRGDEPLRIVGAMAGG